VRVFPFRSRHRANCTSFLLNSSAPAGRDFVAVLRRSEPIGLPFLEQPGPQRLQGFQSSQCHGPSKGLIRLCQANQNGQAGFPFNRSASVNPCFSFERRSHTECVKLARCDTFDKIEMRLSRHQRIVDRVERHFRTLFHQPATNSGNEKR
jgi:hypothetical protein